MSVPFFTIVWWTRIARLVVNAMLVPLSLWLFQYGWWLDIVLSLIVVQLQRTIVIPNGAACREMLSMVIVTCMYVYVFI
ncbi:MAG TPA: hypothetical protein VFB56_04200 [Nitrospiraceae bacterium]|nr:hypothetical protein [Nitrospiraceae bacterium]